MCVSETGQAQTAISCVKMRTIQGIWGIIYFQARAFAQNWLVVWNIFNFPIYWESHHPNWRTIFFRGVAQPPTRFSSKSLCAKGCQYGIPRPLFAHHFSQTRRDAKTRVAALAVLGSAAWRTLKFVRFDIYIYVYIYIYIHIYIYTYIYIYI